ncbi:galactose oxidase early set domain-containing protein [Gimesia maris]|uniref:Galactose oxidase-like Early set domain-containing protein n=1 Tax=Gimesia maris TaxID=122 RepID=A0ABX5YNJ6_9PLAN|nr:galactose oxidase early set domain-containing protein [Gimesia maris]EDL62355.1 hypothetical protein PM8797T_28544 [Gimesia maris DSM 8797]QEG17254.1 hypothetical protein GmarT_31320 [Gimesia maris]QGQ29648.1 DUF1929 domain-containing protein [Gimesia maris]
MKRTIKRVCTKTFWIMGLIAVTQVMLTPGFVSAASWEITATSGFQWDPSEVKLSLGDDVTFKLSGDPQGIPHGLHFNDWDSIKQVFEIEAVQGQQSFNATTGQNSASTNMANKVLFKAKIKSIPDGLSEISYVCIEHGGMRGNIVLGATDGDMGVEKMVRRLSPSMQRRMLKFINQARSPRELTKSPQERRVKFEHGPSAARPKYDRRHEGVVAYDLATAKMMLENRPLDGYTDVRDCLKLYKESETERFEDLLNSLGPPQFGEWREVATVAEGDEEEPVMHAAMLHTGKVLLIPSNNRTVLWDPDPAVATPIEIINGEQAGTGLTANLFCSGHSFLSDGRLLVVGGGGGNPGAASSIQGWKFDPKTIKWTRTSNDMSFQRWYPTLVTLADEPGKVLVAAGATGMGVADFMEIYSEVTDKFEPVTATGPVGELLFPPTYPGLHLLPGGEVFHTPVGFGDCNQSPSGASADPTAIFAFSNPARTMGAWSTLENNHRRKGMSVLLLEPTSPFVRVLAIGGGDAGTSGTGQTIDLSTFSPTWEPAFPLLEERVHPNAVILPDGTVFICGGMEAGTKPPPNGGRCELYDSKTGSIAEMDELARPRHYHSVAILLPTGEVMAAGGAGRGGCDVSRHNTIEVFKPPYLFRGDRPVINSMRSEVEHGAAFEIDTPNPSAISKIVLARPMAVTHQTDSEQRMITLTYTVTGPGTIEAIAPAGSPNSIAPPGYYMLFILNQDRVPSVAKWILLK